MNTSLIVASLALPLGVVLACNPGIPMPPAEAMAPPSLGGKCSPNVVQTRPLVVEWPSADRTTLEARMRRGVVPVRYKDCTIEVLARCEAKGRYLYTPTTAKFDLLRMRNVNELYANVPLGAASLEGKLAQAGELGVKMTTVGRYENEKSFVRLDELQGDCGRATHVITGVTTGAFEFLAGASEDASGSAHVAIIGAGGGAKHSSLRETLNRDGDPAACQSSSSKDQSPPDNCGALLRIELAAIGERATPSCPEGSLFNGQECIRTQVLGVVECPAGTRWDGRTCLAPGAAPVPVPVPVPQGSASALAAPPSTAQAASAPTAPAARFAISGSVIQDSRSGLSWALRDAPKTLAWSTARSFCADMGMRLPSQQELAELAGDGTAAATLALNRTAHYWSSSQWANGATRYMAVNVASANVKNDWDDERYFVRCVRNR